MDAERGTLNRSFGDLDARYNQTSVKIRRRYDVPRFPRLQIGSVMLTIGATAWMTLCMAIWNSMMVSRIRSLEAGPGR